MAGCTDCNPRAQRSEANKGKNREKLNTVPKSACVTDHRVCHSFVLLLNGMTLSTAPFESRMRTSLPRKQAWPFAISNIVDHAKFHSRSHDAVIRVYDAAGNVIETHEHKGDFKEW